MSLSNSERPNTDTQSSNMWPAVFAAAVSGLVSALLYAGIFQFTHHRPLGAATLAVMSLGVFVGSFAIAWRWRVGRALALVACAATAILLAAATLGN
jgi:hypothetical protein